MTSLQVAHEAAAAGASLLKLLRVCAKGDMSLDHHLVEMVLRAFTDRLRLALDPDPDQRSGLPAAMPTHKRLLDAGERLLEWVECAREVAEEEAALRAKAAPGEEGGHALNLAPEEFRLEMTPRLREILAKVARSALGNADALEAERAKEARWLLGQVPPAEPCIWYHGGRSYSSDGLSPRVVSAERHNLLQRFLDRDQALTTSDLKDVVDNPSAVIEKLIGQFGGGAIRKPRSKGDGYFIRAYSLSAK
jgi:hypothetical protein